MGATRRQRGTSLANLSESDRLSFCFYFFFARVFKGFLDEFRIEFLGHPAYRRNDKEGQNHRDRGDDRRIHFRRRGALSEEESPVERVRDDETGRHARDSPLWSFLSRTDQT